MADGRKLKPFVVFKGVRAVPELMNSRGVVVALSRNGWMNEELTKDWVKASVGLPQLWTPPVSVGCIQVSHQDSVRSYVDKQTNSDVSVIPRRSYQPPSTQPMLAEQTI